ncbi:glycerophosphodiester phosphodiesterase [Roseibium algae]|uniref:Glycerophosphodiester phosphodiesterase family protein n=1 Tax=Roseibium algae TaxID=3123038 RepID=A0ABU8TGN7_9HYPH
MIKTNTAQKPKLPDWINQPRQRPLAIAHRGASAYAPDNTLEAFSLAADLGADMWEVDIWLSRDGVPIACHDSDLVKVAGQPERINELDAEDLTALITFSGQPIALFANVVDLAIARKTALYLDVKNIEATTATLECLRDKAFERAIFGTTDPEFCRKLKASGCPYPVSFLVGLGKNPFELADHSGADIIHPCWERAGERPDLLLTDSFFTEAARRGMPVVTWHEERQTVARTLCQMPVLGICSDTPELLKPYRDCYPNAPLVVCHRGASTIAPENTLAAANAAFAAGFDFVELDVRKTADGTLAVIHDNTLDRTTDASGEVSRLTLKQLSQLDAGRWFSPHYSGEQIPVLAEMIACAKCWSGQLYIEIKDADSAAVLAEVMYHGFLRHCFFWSFDPEHLRTIRKINPDANLMARREDYSSLEACLQHLDPGIVEFNMTNVSEAEFAAVRATHAKVMIAFMGDDQKTLGKVHSLQPDIVNINDTLGWRKIISNT